MMGINPIARETSTSKLYYLYNGHADVVAMVDVAGTVVNSYSYDIYGNIISANEAGIANPIRYAGQYFDNESEMYYLRARYYDPELMKFISEDSYKGDVNDPLSLNLYVYCEGNPITYFDPSGHYKDIAKRDDTGISSSDGKGGVDPFTLADGIIRMVRNARNARKVLKALDAIQEINKLAYRMSKADAIRAIDYTILDAMESAGGHLIEKHVSMTNQELIQRVFNENTNATSFTNKNIAIKAVQENLRNNADKIAQWLSNPNGRGYFFSEWVHSYDVGYGAEAKSKHIIYGLRETQLYLVKDASSSLGFRIITGYPIIK